MTRETAIRIDRAKVGDALGIARVHVASWRSSYAGILPNDYLAGMSVKQHMGHWALSLRERGSFGIFTAKDARGNVVGFGSCDRSRRRGRDRLGFDGEVQTLYVADDWRNLGIGRALMAVMAEHLQGHGCGSAMVWVLRDNPGRWFYEALGAQPKAEDPIVIAGQPLVQIGYGWPSIDILIDRATARRDE
ncbi:MAG: GNAT family N-acetyltransferase [Acetobacterales bacterium]